MKPGARKLRATPIVIALLVACGNSEHALAQRPRHTIINEEQAYVASLQRRLQKEIAWVSNETNGPALWSKVRRSIDGVLAAEWRNGKLKGEKPAEAYFVRCDRTTKRQSES